jgi:hypothetical protein
MLFMSARLDRESGYDAIFQAAMVVCDGSDPICA